MCPDHQTITVGTLGIAKPPTISRKYIKKIEVNSMVIITKAHNALLKIKYRQ